MSYTHHGNMVWNCLLMFGDQESLEGMHAFIEKESLTFLNLEKKMQILLKNISMV